MRARSAVARLAFRDQRIKTASFAGFAAIYALGQVAAYAHSYSDPAVRASFAKLLGDNVAVRMFYGTAHDLMTTGGYAAWRVAGITVILYSVWAALFAVAALRGEEESGRAELVLAGGISRSQRFGAVLMAAGAGMLVLFAATALGLIVGGLPAGPSLFMALAVSSVIPVFVGFGAWASFIAPERRVATEIAASTVVLAFLLRVIADTADAASWVRWLTPLGWAEEARPFTGAQPLVLLLPLAASIALLWTASIAATRRDLGAGIIAARDRAEAKLRLLRSPVTLGLREMRGSLIAWLLGGAVYALVIGAVSKMLDNMKIPKSLQEQFLKFGGAELNTARGYLSVVFLIFVFALSLFAAAQVGAARRVEADGRLETLFAQPTGRVAWLLGRFGLAIAGLVTFALTLSVCAWIGASSQGVDISLVDLLGAGANTLPAALLFLGLGMLAYAISPRAGAGVAYALVAVTFVWELFGALLGAPAWTLDLSPFHHIGMVPTQAFQGTAAAAMIAIGIVAAGLALVAFRRRDLAGS